MTQQALATKTGIAVQQINKWVNGRTRPNAGSLIAMADVLHCSIDRLLGRGLRHVETNELLDEIRRRCVCRPLAE